jgi:hypothetical protein
MSEAPATLEPENDPRRRRRFDCEYATLAPVPTTLLLSVILGALSCEMIDDA